MSRDVNYVDSVTVVPANNLNDFQEGTTGLSIGLRLETQTANTQIRVNSDSALGQFAARVGPKTRYGASIPAVTGSGAAGARQIYLTTGTADTPKLPALEIYPTGTVPTTAYFRQIGSATWDGSVYTDVKLIHGVQASAFQFNSMVVQPLLASAVPLTARGLASQTADIFRAETSALVAPLRVTPTSVITTTHQITGTLSVPQGNANAPSVNFAGDATTGMYSPASNQVGFSAGGFSVMTLTSGGALSLPLSGPGSPLNFGSDVSIYRGGSNRLDLAGGDSLNIAGGAGNLLFAGVALASSHLSDQATLVRTSGGIFGGPIYVPAVGPSGSPSIGFSTDTDTGLFLQSDGVLGVQAGGQLVATLTDDGLFSLTQPGNTAGIEIGDVHLFSGEGGSYVGAAQLTAYAESLELHKNNGPTSLILRRPDGTRVAISVSNTNEVQVDIV